METRFGTNISHAKTNLNAAPHTLQDTHVVTHSASRRVVVVLPIIHRLMLSPLQLMSVATMKNTGCALRGSTMSLSKPRIRLILLTPSNAYDSGYRRPLLGSLPAREHDLLETYITT